MVIQKKAVAIAKGAIVLTVGLLLSIGVVYAATTTQIVTPENIGVDWFTHDTRAGGDVSFVNGPATPPLGIGSVEMTTTDTQGGAGQAKAQLFNYDHIGTVLADIDAISYWAYRSANSTNPTAQTISLNLEVDFEGDGTSFTTLVFEPVYNVYQGSMLTDTWQQWDAYDGGNAIWWSTQAISGVCAFNCFVPWSTIVAKNPDAKVQFAFGFNVGSGWVGEFSGNADALTLGVNGDTTTYDFEPYKVAKTKDDCKNGGWQVVKRADGSSFKNQGDCIQYVNTGK